MLDFLTTISSRPLAPPVLPNYCSPIATELDGGSTISDGLLSIAFEARDASASSRRNATAWAAHELAVRADSSRSALSRLLVSSISATAFSTSSPSAEQPCLVRAKVLQVGGGGTLSPIIGVR